MSAILCAALEAADCQPDDIRLGSQIQVDRFQTEHGPCDRVRGALMVEGADISSLAGLADLVRIDGHLLVAETSTLQDLTGLERLASVGGDVGIFHNFGMQGLDGLTALARVEGGFGVYANPEQVNVDGLSSLAHVGGYLVVSDLHSLTDVDGLRSLVSVGNHLGLRLNHSLRNLDGLSALETVGGTVGIARNDSLTNVDGLISLSEVGFHLQITENPVLSTLDGLFGVHRVGFDVVVESNGALAACAGLLPLLDETDDGAPGPGPAPPGAPDVGGRAVLRENLHGCNSIVEIHEGLTFEINPGISDAWHNPARPGQGLFITVWPDIGRVFLAWATYDVERPMDSVIARLGDPAHRWLTAFGPYAGNEAMLQLTVTRGGVFDAAEPSPVATGGGSLLLQFTGCNAGTVRYEIPAVGRTDVFHIERLAPDNIVHCK